MVASSVDGGENDALKYVSILLSVTRFVCRGFGGNDGIGAPVKGTGVIDDGVSSVDVILTGS